MRAAPVKNNPRPLWDLTKEVAPGFIRSSSPSDGALMPNTTSASHASPTVAPASTKD